jgi:hypothetical protein
MPRAINYSMNAVKEEQDQFQTLFSHDYITKIDTVHTGLHSALFGQLSLELLVIGQESCVQFTNLLLLIHKNVSFSESFYCVS